MKFLCWGGCFFPFGAETCNKAKQFPSGIKKVWILDYKGASLVLNDCWVVLDLY